jgi:membrane carboxypeptidase/penicillin-binding protein
MKILKKLLGIDKIEAETRKAIEDAERATRIAKEATEQAEQAKEAERIAKLSPKELANEKKEPWVAVLDTHVNQDNVRNGFFELDWNEFFVLQLRSAGYSGTTDEEIVDKWFQELCRNVGADSGVDMERRGSGFINVNNLGNGKSEVS